MIDLDRDLEYLVGRIDLWKEYKNDEVLEDALEEIYHILSTINDVMKQDNEEILHDRIAKEIGNMTDEEVEKNVKKYFQKEEHPPECPWHKDWHSCNCGLFDKESKE